jgi:hypothetical protein
MSEDEERRKEAKWLVDKQTLDSGFFKFNRDEKGFYYKLTPEDCVIGNVSIENADRWIDEKNRELGKPDRISLEEYKTKMKSWLCIEDDEILDIVVSAIISEKVGGDPLWIFLIAPPGGTKTELLRSFNGDYSIHLSDMTSKTLISGLMIGTGKNRKKIKDLLPALNGKVLIFKDFTTILEKGKEERREIIAQFREAYDGSFAKKVGTADNIIKYDSRFGLVAGVTPVIDDHWKLMQQLGERFLKIRWVENADKVTRRARMNEGGEVIMRSDLSAFSNNLIESFDFNNIPEFDDEKFGDEVSLIAKFIAHGRTPVKLFDSYSDECIRLPIPEMPTRLVKQLKKLAKCLAFIRRKSEVTDDEINTLKRVARDTLPPDRMAVLNIISAFQHETLEGCSRTNISNNLKIPRTTIRRILEQLVALDLIYEKKIFDRNWGGNDTDNEYFYKISDVWGYFFGPEPKKSGDSKE